MNIKRLQIFNGLQKNSLFLWGPRQVGKSTLLKDFFSDAYYLNFLDPLLFDEYTRTPGKFKDDILTNVKPDQKIVLDEVQKMPRLLDVVQLLIDEHHYQFVMSGSSARKLKRGGGNLLGGRALRYQLFPFVSHEIPDFDLMRALNHGLLPRHYLDENPQQLVSAYVGDYLKEEILAEGLTRNIQAFSLFLEKAAFSNGELVNFTKIASECGVHSTTVKEYFQILEDTLVGRFHYSYQRRPKRRITKMPKFYFFDVSIANHLLKRGSIEQGGESFGRAFEHFLYQELMAHSHYSGLNYPVTFWRTHSDFEVDFILGEAQVAIEVKGSTTVTHQHLKGLKAFLEEYQVQKVIVVSQERIARYAGPILILPWQDFLNRLWRGEVIS